MNGGCSTVTLCGWQLVGGGTSSVMEVQRTGHHAVCWGLRKA